MFDLIVAVRREHLQIHQEVVFMFGLQHGQDVLQVLQVDMLRTLGGTQHADDAFSDVGQVSSLRLLHGPGWKTETCRPSRCLQKVYLSKCLITAN